MRTTHRVVGMMLVAALALTAGTCSDATGPSSVVTALALAFDTVTLTRGDSVTLFVSGRDAQGLLLNRPPVQWSSRNPRVADVHPVGSPAWVIGVAAGRTVVSVVNGGARDSTVVVVTLPRSVRVTPSLDTLTSVGAVVDLQAVARDSTGPVAAQFTWRSRSSAVADVSQTGRVTARGDGATYIVALEPLGNSDSVLVVVHRIVSRILVTPARYSEPLERQLAFHATALDADSVPIPAVRFTWSSSDAAIATVDTAGVATTVAPGVDTVRAGAGGVTGSAVLTSMPLPILRFNLDTIYAGVGVFLSDFPRPFPGLMRDAADSGKAFTAQLHIADSLIARIPDTVSVPNGYYPSIEWDSLVGKRPGRTQLTAMAAGYAPGNATLVVTTPHLTAGLYRTDTTVGVNQKIHAWVGLRDSLGDQMRAARAFVIRVRSSDTLVLRADVDSVAVSTRDYGALASATPVDTGTGWLVFSASGFLPDSERLTVTPARLRFVAPDVTPVRRATIGAGEYDAPDYVSSGDAVLTDSIVVTLSHRHPERLQIPATVKIPGAGYPSTSLIWTGLTPGPDTLIASAPGYLPDTMVVEVTPGTFVVQGLPATGLVTNVARLELFVADTFGAIHYPLTDAGVTVHVTSSDTTLLLPGAATATIPRSTGGGGAVVYFLGVGTATIRVADSAGAFVPSLRSTSVGPMPLAVTARGGRYEGTRTTELGMRQSLQFYDALPLVRFTAYGYSYPFRPFPVHLRSTRPHVALAAVSDVIPDGGSGQALFDIVGGDSTGSAWIVAEGAGMIPDSLEVVVGQPYFAFTTDARGLETGSGSLEIQLRDQAGNIRAAAEPVPIALRSTDPAIVVPDSDQVTLPAGAYKTTITVRFLSPGTAAIIATDARTVPQRYEAAASAPITVSPVPTP